MFNLGHWSITEAELSADLAALGEPAPAGHRLLGEFYFVHAAEAGGGKDRGYEFLHATFIEYLVATRVVAVLDEVAEGAFGRRRFHEPDDALLFALLSHQPLAIQRPVLDFVGERLAALDGADLADVVRTLDMLVPAYSSRPTATEYVHYRPTPANTVRALAAYSANLVLLRLLANAARVVPMGTLFPGEPGRSTWRATVQLWSAGLDVGGFRAVVAALFRKNGTLFLRSPFNVDAERLESSAMVELNAAELRGDGATARRLRFGHALLDNDLYTTLGGTWKDDTMVVLLNNAMGFTFPLTLPPPPANTTEEDRLSVARVAWGVLGINTIRWGENAIEEFVLWLLDLPLPNEASPRALALATLPFDGLLRTIRTKPRDWSPKTTAFVARATESAESADSADLIREYLKTVLPMQWDLGFIH